MTSTFLSRVFVAATLLLMAAFALGPNTSVAQDGRARPLGWERSRIRRTSMPDLRQYWRRRYPLTDLTSPDMTGTPAAGTPSTPIAVSI